MQEATDRLMARFQGNAAIVVSYARGATTISGISATAGRTPFQLSDGNVVIAYESRDYIINSSDIASLGNPASGDIVTEANGRTYEVSIPKPLAVYESIGPAGTVFKIHTKGIT